ncbi:hypothetical protein [Methylohalobius crimeensis]|uniref:hypothetical protein n=1 Tax=Methylohalobius crimeensis TaxID=244365 RepID=UPI0003F9B382|nr:hypothetical protein [Methylohalobius crimeensis]
MIDPIDGTIKRRPMIGSNQEPEPENQREEHPARPKKENEAWKDIVFRPDRSVSVEELTELLDRLDRLRDRE